MPVDRQPDFAEKLPYDHETSASYCIRVMPRTNPALPGDWQGGGAPTFERLPRMRHALSSRQSYILLFDAQKGLSEPPALLNVGSDENAHRAAGWWTIDLYAAGTRQFQRNGDYLLIGLSAFAAILASRLNHKPAAAIRESNNASTIRLTFTVPTFASR